MAINCEKASLLMALYLDKEAGTQDNIALESHLDGCAACRQEMALMRQMHIQLGRVKVSEPDMPKMQLGFYQMLEAYQGNTGKKQNGWLLSLQQYLQAYWQPAYALQLLMGCLLLLLGWAGGYLFQASKNNGQEQIGRLTAQVQQMREAMLLTMLQQPAATDRLKAVTYTQDLVQVDDKVITALLQTLNNDPNVNVRLVTVEALYKLAAHPRVREGLIQSITRQESPLVQIALADVMVALQEKGSVAALKGLLEKEDLNEAVKDKVKSSVHVLL